MSSDRSFRGVLSYWLVLALILAVSGCGRNEDPPAPQIQEDRAAELSKQLETERRDHARTMAVAQAEQVEAAEDFRVVSMILASTGIGMVLLVLVLARKHRSRRILERLLRIVLNRLHRTVVPPAPPINRPPGLSSDNYSSASATTILPFPQFPQPHPKIQ